MEKFSCFARSRKWPKAMDLTGRTRSYGSGGPFPGKIGTSRTGSSEYLPSPSTSLCDARRPLLRTRSWTSTPRRSILTSSTVSVRRTCDNNGVHHVSYHTHALRYSRIVCDVRNDRISFGALSHEYRHQNGDARKSSFPRCSLKSITHVARPLSEKCWKRFWGSRL